MLLYHGGKSSGAAKLDSSGQGDSRVKLFVRHRAGNSECVSVPAVGHLHIVLCVTFDYNLEIHGILALSALGTDI
jgi:hypothetical protein